MIFVLTNVQLRSIFEEHTLGSVWKHLPFSIKLNFSVFPVHLPPRTFLSLRFFLLFFMRTVSTSCSVCSHLKFYWTRHKPRRYLAIQYLSKTFDIWVERYLVIFNDNLAIFDDWNAHTGARKLPPKRYCKFCHLLPSGRWALEFSF